MLRRREFLRTLALGPIYSGIDARHHLLTSFITGPGGPDAMFFPVSIDVGIPG
jgi:hypothetical protein